MRRRWWCWPTSAVHRLDIHATPEQWQAWNAAARLCGVSLQVWLTQAGDAHARNLQRSVKGTQAAGKKGKQGLTSEPGGEVP